MKLRSENIFCSRILLNRVLIFFHDVPICVCVCLFEPVCVLSKVYPCHICKVYTCICIYYSCRYRIPYSHIVRKINIYFLHVALYCNLTSCSLLLFDYYMKSQRRVHTGAICVKIWTILPHSYFYNGTKLSRRFVYSGEISAIYWHHSCKVIHKITFYNT